MSKLVKNVMIYAIKEKIKEGQDFEKIIENYPRLTVKEIEELHEAIIAN